MAVINPPIELLFETETQTKTEKEMIEKPKKAWILYKQESPSSRWVIEGIIFSFDNPSIAEKYIDGIIFKNGMGYWAVPTNIIV